MNHFGKKVVLTALCVLGIAFLPAWAVGQTTQAIYKHTDVQGRITYSNAPIVGGVRVELDPITLIPATPSGSLVNPNLPRPVYAPSSVPASVPVAAPAPAVNNIEVATAVEPAALKTALVPTPLPVPSSTSPSVAAASPGIPRTAVTPAPVAVVRPVAVSVKRLTPPVNAQQPLAMDVLIQQRRDEIKLRMMQNAVNTESKLLADAKAKLAEENVASEGVRAIKASFHTAARAGKTDKLALVPIISAEERAKVERHFERVRDLQDQISMHEKNLDDLRAVLKVETSTVKVAAAFIQPSH